MSGCEPGPPQAAARRGYWDACFVNPSALEAYDSSLQPFDVMTQATLTFPAPATVWTTVVEYQMPPGSYGILRYVGQDCDDLTAYQRVTWRIIRNQGVMGGDRDGIIPALEARCGILDGTMMPFRFFIPPGGFVSVQAYLQTGPSDQVVRARLQGERRDSFGVVS